MRAACANAQPQKSGQHASRAVSILRGSGRGCVGWEVGHVLRLQRNWCRASGGGLSSCAYCLSLILGLTVGF